ncbi:oxidoreductase [Bhargavaea cecembensis]|uniref:Oxidoreductase n=1 Tax=Bhargavaea cecembensis TaxID=394098 RepID=A0A165HJ76_9BACL|nr:FAD-dependent oxidoreductase [Bhargavaea cecembensis]KZE40174.1 oxidoreductase [Bhargavaea cecembensis]
MVFFQDVISIFKKRDMGLIERRKESEDVYTFLFEREKDLTWKAGQHGLFSITHKKIKNATRPFSVSSAPADNHIAITMRISDAPSEFKKALMELTPGMKVSMSGPVGSFYLQGHRPSLLIAGGIGITPFRAMLKQIEAEKNRSENPIRLLYLDSDQSYIFKDELDRISGSPSIEISYLDSRDTLHREIDQFTDTYQGQAQYYIAGPKPMVESVSAHLKEQDVLKRDIKKDAFFGYR